MVINFTEEIWKGFKKQYPEKEEAYTKLLRGDYNITIDGLKVYEDMIEVLSFLIKLIVKLNKKNNYHLFLE